VRQAHARRSLQIALALAGLGVVLSLSGARATWVTVTATTRVAGLGEGVVGTAAVTGDDLAAFSGITLLGLLVALGVTVTRGRGRWVVGLGLVACGLALAVLAQTERTGAAATAQARATSGRLETIPASARLDTSTSPLGPLLVTAGGAALAAAGTEALRRGAAWPALGDAFRAPPDRAQTPAPTPGSEPSGGPDRPGGDTDEPPWQGD
jgi:Tryptophan-associated transmembrane protein (Trp_oprn_chp)